MSATTTVYIAPDIVRGILEGDTIDKNVLLKRLNECDVVLPKECVCQAMEEVENPTVAGIHGLADLICVAGIRDGSLDQQDEMPVEDRSPIGFIPADTFLAILIGVMPLQNLMGLFDLADRMRTSTDERHLWASLLSVEEGDSLNLKYLAGLLRLVSVPPVEFLVERANWEWPLDAVLELRSKAVRPFMPDPERN